MAARAPQPDLNAFPEPRYAGFRHWLAFAAARLGLLPRALTATKAWNPPNVADAASVSTTVSVPGARRGDAISVGFHAPLAGGMSVGGTMVEDNVVVVTLSNLSGSAQNYASHTLRVIVWRLD